jgi:hypothetical protein
LYCRDEVEAGRLPRSAFAVLREAVLREAVLRGEVDRGTVAVVPLQERAARNVTAALIGKRLLVSTSSRTPLRLAFPLEAVERWFSSMYPDYS